MRSEDYQFLFYHKTTIASISISPPLTVPLLENGGKLSLKGLDRRYEVMINPKKAELIEAIVYINPLHL